MPINAQTDPVEIEGGMRALIASADTSAGDLVAPDLRGFDDARLRRPILGPRHVELPSARTSALSDSVQALH
jgi:hypothetical protein